MSMLLEMMPVLRMAMLLEMIPNWRVETRLMMPNLFVAVGQTLGPILISDSSKLAGERHLSGSKIRRARLGGHLRYADAPCFSASTSSSGFFGFQLFF